MLKEPHMSLEEIKKYLNHPDIDRFYRIADSELEESNQEIRRLKKTKDILKRQKQQLDLCRSITHQEPRTGNFPDAWLATIPYAFADNASAKALCHLRKSFDAAQYRMGFGSYITQEFKISNFILFVKHGGDRNLRDLWLFFEHPLFKTICITFGEASFI